MRIKRDIFILALLLIIGTFLRVYNLNWGSPFYFHPDERNIASSVSQLSFPHQLNPHFFAYGSIPIYVVYAIGFVMNAFSNPSVTFEKAILIGRLISGVLSISIVFLLFYVGKKLKNSFVGFLSALLGLFNVGFIQFAHFGTFEMWLTFFGLLLFYHCINLYKHYSSRIILFSGIIFGILVAIKVSSIVLIVLPIAIFVVNFFQHHELRLKNILQLLAVVFMFLISAAVIFVITNPYVFLDFGSFHNSMQYESSVALGSLQVFYTGEFFSTIPVVFQFIKIYPFLLNPLLTLIFIPSFFYVVVISIKRKNFAYMLLTTCYLLLFLSQAFFFAKWTRYMVPTIPFMLLIISIFLGELFSSYKRIFSIKYLALNIILVASIVFSLSYTITAFVEEDTRTQAARWAGRNISKSTPTVADIYDMGIVPFNTYLNNITLFNYYDLDNGNATEQSLQELITKSDYVILPSQRILKTRLMNKDKFPIGNNFYINLLGSAKFKKIYETPCDAWCNITYLGNPSYTYEETANVFDRPTVYIFKKKF